VSDGLLLGIDEGTTAVKAALFDLDLRPVASARRAKQLVHPGPGLAEQDPEAILSAVRAAVADVLAQAPGERVVAAGLDHQGESVLAWDAESGKALSPVLTWQDKRHEDVLARVDREAVAARSGLPVDPYFSAGRFTWLLESSQAVAAARDRGALRLGTVDAFVADRLGGRFATDLSTASRTQLLATGGHYWDQQLLDAFGLRREWLPAISPTYGDFGELWCDAWPVALPLTAQLVDQQAALAGSGATAPGEIKATFGTGVFVLGHCEQPAAPAGLLPTVAWAAPAGGAALAIGEVRHALDGGVFAAGALLQWLASLGLAADPPALAALAAQAPDSAGVLILPAIAGLGAPWWRAGARGVIAGLTGAAGAPQIARAALEAIAMRVADVVEAMAQAGPVRSVRADGGLSTDATLLALQADALGIPVDVGRADTTVLGAALLAGVGAGVYPSVEDAAQRIGAGRRVPPRAAPDERAYARARWKQFVAAAAEL
jgi:glycerol kinase